MLRERESISIDSHQYTRERDYWLHKLSGELVKSFFPYDFKSKKMVDGWQRGSREFYFSSELVARLMKISGGYEYTLHMIFTAVVAILLARYTGSRDIIVGMPIYKQDSDEEFVNTVLALRIQVEESMSFKELLLQVRQHVIEADEYQNYAIETLLHRLNLPYSGEDFPLFDVAVLLENIHYRKYLQHIHLNVIFSFTCLEDSIKAVLEFNPSLYREETVDRIIDHFSRLLESLLNDVDIKIGAVELLSNEEKERLLFDFNDTSREYPHHKTIGQLFEEQVDRTPDSVAVVEAGAGVFRNADMHSSVFLTYVQLNEEANQLAHLLRKNGVKPGTLVALLMERTTDMIKVIMGVIKAGGAYLPIAPETPLNRILQILEDAQVPLLLTHSKSIAPHSFTALQKLQLTRTEPFRTPPRPPIANLDTLPMPDRSLIDYEKYARNISLAMVKYCITLQGTRGCPYNCAYCARLWPKKQVVRSAENLFDEVMHYYRMGVRRFSIIDDIFNLDKKNSQRFFRLIIDNGLDLQLLFPAGLRGDIMTKEYIDLMVEAGTINISLALETASPRLQKLIRKNLDIDKLHRNLEYICDKHPDVILDLFTMHGLPTETEAEALMTLDFIKSLEWLHFPLINITRIYPNTDLEKLALESGITRESILRAESLAWHEAAETLPFDKSFTNSYQAEFLDKYFLKKERLLHVLPYQMKVLSEDEISRKYNSYLPTDKDIKNLDDLLEFTGICKEELAGTSCVPEERFSVPGLNHKIRQSFPVHQPAKDALRLLLLDLSQSYTADRQLLDELFEPPLGLMYLLTYLNQKFDSRIHGKIAKSGIDFDSDEELRTLLVDFNPQVIGLRTLTFYKDFFHRTVSKIRQWDFRGPIIAGGPYATNGYISLLQDRNIDVVVLAEGEITFSEVIHAIIKNQNRLPPEETLGEIPGLVFQPGKQAGEIPLTWEIVMMDEMRGALAKEKAENPKQLNKPMDAVYSIFTSGSTGIPKGVLVRHRNLQNLVIGLHELVYKKYSRPLKLALVSPFIFDASVKQIFAALLLGHTLYIVPEDVRADGYQLMEYFKEQKIEVTDGTPTHIKLLLETGLQDSSNLYLKHLLIGGETLPGDVIQEFFGHFRENAPLITNVYGPTECSVDVASYQVSAASIAESEDIPIGKPMPNHCLYILDAHDRLQPCGIAGEVGIAGHGVSTGYLNRVELTAEKFKRDVNSHSSLVNSHSSLVISSSKRLSKSTNDSSSSLSPNDQCPMTNDSSSSLSTIDQCPMTNDRLYKTGDLALWLPDGNILFLGRKDNQVKVRGYRLELGEIESQLLKHEKVKDAVLVVHGKDSGNHCLCAYVVPSSGDAFESSPTVAEALRKYLSPLLPDYMLPTYYVLMERIPLTFNGKVDRKALPEPEVGDTGFGYTAPRNEREEKLEEIWSDVLKIDPQKIGIDTDFFEIGGHSLRATILISKVHKAFDIRIPLQEIFKTPTIRGISEYIKGCQNSGDRFAAIPIAEQREYYPLSSAQRRLYFVQQMDLNSTSYNLLLPVLLEGSLDMVRLTDTFLILVNRHRSLRTCFEVIKSEPRQKISAKAAFTLERYEIEEEEVRAFIEKTFARAFDLRKAPLFRAAVIKIGVERYILVVNLHHIIADGTSLGILMNEFMTLYDKKELPPLRLQYNDFSQWQNSREQEEFIKKQEGFWLEQFAGEIPKLELPGDFPRPELQSFAGSSIQFRIGRKETQMLKEMADQEDVTLYMLLLAVFNVFLFRITGQEDIIVGSPLASRRHADLQSIVGMFVNMLVIRNYPRRSVTFQDFLRDLRKRCLQALENQDYKFEDLVEQVIKEKDHSRNPLFDVAFALQNMEIPTIEIKRLRLVPFEYWTRTSRFDFAFIAFENGEEINVLVEYCTALFKEETIRLFIKNSNEVIAVVLENRYIPLQDIAVSSGDVAASKPYKLQLDMGF